MNKVHNKAEYKFRLNNSMYETTIECPTREQILEIAEKDSDGHDLFFICHGKQEPVKPGETICLSKPGLERFIARPRKVNDGFKGGESLLPFNDVEYLNETFSDGWELRRIDNLNLLFIKDFDLPQGYNISKSDIIIIIPDRYNSVQLDMVYFQHNISRLDGKAIPNLSPRNFGGVIYQQWSRHRTPENPWIIGVDCIQTHIELIRTFLRKEFER
jgi:hypothetical protein